MSEPIPCGQTSDGPTIAFSRFSTQGLAPEEGLEIWRASIAPMFDAWPERPDEPFFGVVDAYLFDGLVLARSRASAQRFWCDRRMLRRDRADHFLVQQYLRGGYTGEHGGRQIRVGAGDTGVLDLGAEIDTGALEFECLSLIVPRDLLRSRTKGVRVGGAVLPGGSPMGRILTSHLAVTWSVLPELSGREAPFVAQGLLDVLAAAIGARARGGAEAREPLLQQPTALAMRAYIEQHLDDHQLDPDLLCHVFRCSRSYLYRLFDGEGGVVRYIQLRRLQRCYRDLKRASGTGRRVGEIAGRWGFTNASHFSRLFRDVHGRSPREVMRQPDPAAGPAPGARPGACSGLPAYRDWLLRL